MTDNPLTEPQIQAAIRALDAGDRPARATLRTALLMALAWHAAQAEIAALRGRMAHLATERETAYGTMGTTMEVVDQLVGMLGEPQEPGRTALMEIARLRARVVALESTVRNLQVWANRIVMCPQCGHTELEYPGAGVIWCPACTWENDPMAPG